MTRVLLAIGGVLLALAALAGLAFAPTIIGADFRRVVAVKAVQAGMSELGVALLTPLANAGDAKAQNNLAVLLMRGIGTVRDPAKAAQLLNAAANAGVARAEMNLALIRTPCDTQYVVQTTAKLEGFARAGDRRAASFVADCLFWSPSRADYPGLSKRLMDAAAIATKTSDPDDELKFGWLLMLQARGAQGWGMDAARREVAQAAAKYLFRAAEHGRPAAYEGIAMLHRESLTLLPDAENKKVGTKKPDEWIDLAAREGHPKSRCAVGARLAGEFAQRSGAASEAERKRFQDYFESCLKAKNPRQVILLGGGKETTLGHDPLFDIWMREDPFLITSPRYENYDYDTAGRDDALAKITRQIDKGRSRP